MKKNIESGKALCVEHFTKTVRDGKAFEEMGNGAVKEGEINVEYGYGGYLSRFRRR